MIFRWTVRAFLVIFLAAVGRIGLRRSATRVPAGRLYASELALLGRVLARFRLRWRRPRMR